MVKYLLYEPGFELLIEVDIDGDIVRYLDRTSKLAIDYYLEDDEMYIYLPYWARPIRIKDHAINTVLSMIEQRIQWSEVLKEW